MKNDTRAFSSSLYSFKLNCIQRKYQRVAFANKISISSYSSNIDPQTSKQMFIDDFHFNLFEAFVEGGQNALANYVAKERFITKMVRFAKQQL